MSSVHTSHTSNWKDSQSAPFDVENVISSGAPTQAAYDMVVARNRFLEDQIQARDQTIALQRNHLEDILSDKADLKAQLTESYEVSKMLKEGKEELFLAVVNLNERLEAQNKISSEAQSVFLKLPAAIRALRRLDDETVKLRKEKTDQEKEIDSLRSLLTSSQGENEKSLSEVTSIRSDYAESLSSFKDVKHILEKANAAAVANAASANSKLEEVRLTLTREKQIHQAERESQLEENEKLKSQLETRSLMLTLKAPKSDTDSEEGEQTGGMGKEFLQIVDGLKYNLFKSEMARKQLHNQLQELRGNIRVFVRCRPYINYDGDDAMALDNASVTNDSRICGSVRFYKDGSSLSLAGCINARDKPQVMYAFSYHTKIVFSDF
jgi:DNA repair exonuclease SbcCD ATPase subunit